MSKPQLFKLSDFNLKGIGLDKESIDVLKGLTCLLKRTHGRNEHIKELIRNMLSA